MSSPTPTISSLFACLRFCPFSLTEIDLSMGIVWKAIWSLTYFVINFFAVCQPYLLLKQTSLPYVLTIFRDILIFLFRYEKEALGLFMDLPSCLLPFGHLINVCIIIFIFIRKCLWCVPLSSLRSWIIYPLYPFPKMILLPRCSKDVFYALPGLFKSAQVASHLYCQNYSHTKMLKPCPYLIHDGILPLLWMCLASAIFDTV